MENNVEPGPAEEHRP